MVIQFLQKNKYVFFGLLLLVFLFKPNTVSAATRYWVGGCTTPAWSCSSAGTTNWGSASNTRDNASVPGSSDDVFFDGVGFGASNSTSTTAVQRVKSLDMTGYTGILEISSNQLISIDGVNGNLTLGSGMTITPMNVGAGFQFTATSGTSTVTTNGVLMPAVTFNGSGGSFVLADNFTINSVANSRAITLTAGTLHMDGANDNLGLTHTIGQFSSSNTNVRTLALGNSSTTIITTSGNTWGMGTPTNLSILPNNATVTFVTAPSVFPNFGGLNMNGLSLVFSGTGVRGLTPGGSTFKNITRVGTASKTDTFTFNSTGSLIVTGTLTIAGDSSVNRILVTNFTLGTPTTITANGTISVSNADFRDITGAGSASWDLSAATGGSGDALGNSGITFTPAQTNYWVGNGGSWSDSTHWASSSGGTGGTGRVPLPQDDVRFDANSFTSTGQTVTSGMSRSGASIDWTGAQNTPTWADSCVSETHYGSLTLISGMNLNRGCFAYVQENRSPATVNFAGKTHTASFTIQAVGSSVTLMSALTTSGNLSISDGTFNTNNFNVTAAGIISNSGRTRTINMGSGSWTLTGFTSNGNSWNVSSSGLTLNSNSSTIIFSNTSSNGKTFTGAGLTYNNLTILGGGSGVTTISGSNTFNTLTIGAPKTITFTSGTTQRINRFVALGTSSNTITLNASTGGSVATLSMPGANTFVGDYLAITDLNATGGAKWYAGANSTLSNSTGWLLQAGPQRRGSFIQDAKVRLERGKMIINAR